MTTNLRSPARIMKVFTLCRTPLNLQKCLLPDCEFLEQNYGRYCLISAGNCSLLVKIGLSEVKHVDKALFLDDSVWVYTSLDEINTKLPTNTSFENFTVLSKPKIIKSINVTVVFSDLCGVKKYRHNETLCKIVQDILKLFTVCDRSIVYLNKLENQRFGIFCIIVNKGIQDQVIKIDSSTKIIIKKCINQLQFEQFQKKNNEPLVGGCSRVYSILQDTIQFSKCNKKGLNLVNKVLLIGPRGCGKTTLVHNVARNLKCILLEITAIDINALTLSKAEAKLMKIFEEAKLYASESECCVILIEDIDLMSSGKSLHARRFTGHLVTLLEEIDSTSGVVVVATTSNVDDVDMQLRRPKRLEDELEIMIPTAEERSDILEKIFIFANMKFDEELLYQISSLTPGFVGADLKLLIIEALMLYKKQVASEVKDNLTFLACVKQALTKVFPSALRGAIGLCATKNVTFSQIGGLAEIKKILDLSVKQQLQKPEKFQKLGVSLTRGILLYGPPGCAKTTLVRALAKECNTTFLATSAADLYSPFVGDAEKKIVQLFSQARIGSPSILFIDEIDAVVGSKSGDRERGVQERILSTLLIEMDGVGLKVSTQRDSSLKILGNQCEETEKHFNNGVIVIGATNRPQLLDDALKRPGRFDRLLYVPPPNESERFRILKKLTEKMSLHSSVDLELLAKLTTFYSGADLKNLCQESGLHALRSSNMTASCIRQSDFEFILGEYKPSLNEKVINFYESFQKYNI